MILDKILGNNLLYTPNYYGNRKTIKTTRTPRSEQHCYEKTLFF